MINTTFCPQANAGYIKFSDEKITKTTEINSNIVCDLDAQGMLVGIELISIPKKKIHAYSKNIRFINSEELIVI